MIRNRLNVRQQPPGFQLEYRKLVVSPANRITHQANQRS
jgi:hypothetical protein